MLYLRWLLLPFGLLAPRTGVIFLFVFDTEPFGRPRFFFCPCVQLGTSFLESFYAVLLLAPDGFLCAGLAAAGYGVCNSFLSAFVVLLLGELCFCIILDLLLILLLLLLPALLTLLWLLLLMLLFLLLPCSLLLIVLLLLLLFQLLEGVFAVVAEQVFVLFVDAQEELLLLLLLWVLL